MENDVGRVWAQELYAALQRLSFAAQTSGGTAGHDEELVAAIDQAASALAKAAPTPSRKEIS